MKMQQWVIAAFAIFGAFVACGFGGAGIAWILKWWDTPIAGFCAAFAVVSMTYLTVPSKKRHLSAVAFLIGGTFAWFFLEPSYYPELFPSKAYQPTHIPFVATIFGGTVALGVWLLPYRRNRNEA